MTVTPELVTAVAGLVTALGVAIKQARDARRSRRLERDLERTGVFKTLPRKRP